MSEYRRLLWGILWNSRNHLDGERSYVMSGEDCLPRLFKTREAARVHVAQHYRYIAERADLRVEPYGWRMPKVVRVAISVAPGR